MGPTVELLSGLARDVGVWLGPTGAGYAIARTRFVRSMTKLVGAHLWHRFMKVEQVDSALRHAFIEEAARDAQDLPRAGAEVLEQQEPQQPPSLRALP